MYANKSKPLTVNEIFEAYETHGEDFLILDIFGKDQKTNKDKLRPNGAGSVQYGDVMVKKANGLTVPLQLKFIQITTFGKIRDPKDRDYESLKLSFRKDDPDNADSRFGDAMSLICKTFEKKVNNFSAEGKISVKPKAKSGSLRVHSVIPTFPIQYEAENKESGEIIELENPILWFEIKSKYLKSDEIDKLEQFNNLTYRKDGKPILKKDFSVTICDLSQKKNSEVIRIDSKTGKEIRKTTSHIPFALDSEENGMNNCNIQEFITPGSVLSGVIEMQLTISGRAFNLKTTFKNNSNLYVYPNTNYGKSYKQDLDEEEADEMIPQNMSSSNNQKNDSSLKSNKDDDEEDDENDEDDEEKEDFSDKLDSISDD